MNNIEKAVLDIKKLIEESIIKNGVEGKNNLIRTQIPICILHDAIKKEFINTGINHTLIHPILNDKNGEMKLYGFFKGKDQDICICPNNYSPHTEIMNVEGILKGKKDLYGKEYTEHILSVNVRSQLSSISKNFDTLYERTFAESINLHLRCNDMVLGEFYMIPVYEYDNKLAKNNKVGWKKNNNIHKHIEKYINSFSAINNRNLEKGEEYKYERICLLIVDFRPDLPIIYHTDKELIEAKLLPSNSSASINNMNYKSFFNSILNIYTERFGSDRFK